MDKYEIEHQEALEKLRQCKDRIKDSCMGCKVFFECELRKDYVTKTYKSMSKDSEGGFEF